MYSGVVPLVPAFLKSAPASVSARTTPSCPFPAAMSSGDQSSSLAVLTSTPALISARTTASWPFSAAVNSGVVPFSIFFC